MYIVQKDGKIIFADNVLQNLENSLELTPQYNKTDIEEISEDLIDKAFDGSLYIKGYAPTPTYEEIRQARANAYASEIDPLMSEYNRKKTFNLFEEGEEEALLAEIEAKVAKIKEENPYPEEKEEIVEEITEEIEEKGTIL